MSSVDLTFVGITAVAALRGYRRGFFREAFGLLALVCGFAVAFRWSQEAAEALRSMVLLPLPSQLQSGVGFVAVFLVVYGPTNIAGWLLERLVGGSLAGVGSGVAGSCLAATKSAMALSFVVLFFHLFPLFPILDARLARSTIARPLANLAGNAIRTGLPTESPAGAAKAV